jgi:hypothetical protein
VPEEIEALFEEMIGHQRAKVLAVARTLNPHFTSDDILSPDEFPELRNDPRFCWEDGLLAGLLSAQMAVRASYRDRAEEGPVSGKQ